MPRQKVPQDITSADKIFGPLSLRDFLVLLMSSGFSYMFFTLLDHQTWPPLVFVIMTSALCDVFVKIHGMKFFDFLVAKLLFVLRPKKRIWIMHAAEIDYTKNYDSKKKKADPKAKMKKIAKHKIALSENVDEFSKKLDLISRGPDLGK